MISGKGKGQRKGSILRAEDGTRTRDPDLGKVVLYQLSYFRDYFKNTLPRSLSYPFWGKVVLYQLSYFRNKCYFYKCDCKVTFLFRDDKILSGEN